MLCHGNICRSPFAAALLSRQLERTRTVVQVESAGFLAPGRASPPEAQAAAAQWDVDLTWHRSRHLSPLLIRSADLVVVMEPAQRRVVRERYGPFADHILILGDLDPLPIKTRPIPDPVGGPPAAYERSYARIARCTAVLTAVLRRLPVGDNARTTRPTHFPSQANGSAASDAASTTPGRQSASLKSS